MDTTNAQFRLPKGQFQDESLPRFSPRRLGTILFTFGVIAALVFGWENRADSYLSAADGWGYILGIIGGSMMTLLLFYPLRKKLRFMHSWGPIKYWFRTHMVFGVIGPVLILFHSNFHLGSTNSNVALMCMLLVASSGLVGRFFYTRIHFGLYGHRATLEELRKDLRITRNNLNEHNKLSPRIIEHMKQYERLMLRKRVFLVHLLLLPAIYLRARWQLSRLKHALKQELRILAKKNKWNRKMLHDSIGETLYLLREYFLCVRKTGQLSLYARLFSIWHVMHFPLFIMMVIAGIVHVIAVHAY
ncbi:MAG: hypothetical protein GC149_16570 [Gammaproteobacteria bacterium]|nr:hypothetical protein [Gammaproteobacteria bacterium]